jgi:hypothetical protein
MCFVHCFQNMKTPPPHFQQPQLSHFGSQLSVAKCQLVLWLKVHLSSLRILIKKCAVTKRLSFELSSVCSLTIRSTKQIALTASIPDPQAYVACVQFIPLQLFG